VSEAFTIPLNKGMSFALSSPTKTRTPSSAIEEKIIIESSKTSTSQLDKIKKYKTNKSVLFSSVTTGGDSSTPSNKDETISSWNERLTNIASIASLFCAIDCTVLPLFSVALSFLGVYKTSAASCATSCCQSAGSGWIHQLSHLFANYFVLPVAGTVSIMHFVTKKRLPSLLTALGMSFVYVTNSHGGPILKRVPHDLLHILQHNPIWHRVVNLTGVALMLGANYLSKRSGCSAHTLSGDKCCDHE